MCGCVCHLSMMMAGGQARGESEAIGDSQRRKHHWPLCLSFFFFPLLLSLTAGKRSSPSPPWQSELRQVIPPSTAKSFTSLYPALDDAAAAAAQKLMQSECACVRARLLCAHVQSMAFDLQAHTRINGRRTLWCASVAEWWRVLVCCSTSLSHALSLSLSLGGCSICVFVCVITSVFDTLRSSRLQCCFICSALVSNCLLNHVYFIVLQFGKSAAETLQGAAVLICRDFFIYLIKTWYFLQNSHSLIQYFARLIFSSYDVVKIRVWKDFLDQLYVPSFTLLLWKN